jgi:hypothetical protein
VTLDVFRFDVLVNGGGAVTLQFQRSPFLPLTRTVFVPWNQIVVLPPVAMQLSDDSDVYHDAGGNSLPYGNVTLQNTLKRYRMIFLLFEVENQGKKILSDYVKYNKVISSYFLVSSYIEFLTKSRNPVIVTNKMFLIIYYLLKTSIFTETCLVASI